MEIAFAIFVVAGVSDAVDGFLAKRFNMASELGALLDPLADKALLVSIYVPLGIWASGGLDSSAILHYAAQATTQKLKTFSLSFAGRGFDCARRVAIRAASSRRAWRRFR